MWTKNVNLNCELPVYRDIAVRRWLAMKSILTALRHICGLPGSANPIKRIDECVWPTFLWMMLLVGVATHKFIGRIRITEHLKFLICACDKSNRNRRQFALNRMAGSRSRVFYLQAARIIRGFNFVSFINIGMPFRLENYQRIGWFAY